MPRDACASRSFPNTRTTRRGAVSDAGHVVVVASGDVDEADLAWLDGARLVIAADGGAETLHRHGRRPDVLVGDLDSTSPDLVSRLRSAGTRIEAHPVDKEASDTELAIAAAFRDQPAETSVRVLGAVGGPRLDHELANMLLLADRAYAGRDLQIVHRGTTVRAVHAGTEATLDGPPGSLVTLLPVVGDATGVETRGLRWELHDAVLATGRSRGLSNQVIRAPASVGVAGGTLLIIETPDEEHPR